MKEGREGGKVEGKEGREGGWEGGRGGKVEGKEGREGGEVEGREGNGWGCSPYSCNLPTIFCYVGLSEGYPSGKAGMHLPAKPTPSKRCFFSVCFVILLLYFCCYCC